MADNRSGGGTGMALLIGGLIVAVGFLIYFIFGDDFATTTATTDGAGTTVNVETNAGGGASEGGSTEGTASGSSDGTASGGSTEGGATGGTAEGGSTEGGTTEKTE